MRKQLITTALIVLILGILVYLQFRTWTEFNWHVFWRETSGMNIARLVFAVALIYAVYFLRAVRWKIFLKPRCDARISSLIGPQFIGFTGLALLGRPGELVRPYLIARKENLPISSQLAVWAVERVFDMASVALLLGISLAIFGQRYERFPQIHSGGMLLIGVVAGIAIFVFLIWWKTDSIAAIAERIVALFSRRIATVVRDRIVTFGEGLHTISSLRSFVEIMLLSFAIWLLIALSYWQVVHAYPASPETQILHDMNLPDMLLVMAASMAGSIVQLPGVGGGSQLAVIGILSSDIFRVPNELAASCGIMLWLITFTSVIPAGLYLAHRERLSLRQLSAEGHAN